MQCLCPSEKVNVLTFLIDNLLSSKSLCREIDTRMERVSKFRREKWKVNMKLKRYLYKYYVYPGGGAGRGWGAKSASKFVCTVTC